MGHQPSAISKWSAGWCRCGAATFPAACTFSKITSWVIARTVPLTASGVAMSSRMRRTMAALSAAGSAVMVDTAMDGFGGGGGAADPTYGNGW